MSICKTIVKFVVFLVSLIKKNAQPFEKKKSHFFYKILDLLQWGQSIFLGGKFFCGGSLRPKP